MSSIQTSPLSKPMLWLDRPLWFLLLASGPQQQLSGNLKKTRYFRRHLAPSILSSAQGSPKGSHLCRDTASLRKPAGWRARHLWAGKIAATIKQGATTPFLFSGKSKLFNGKFQNMWQPRPFSILCCNNSMCLENRNAGSLTTAAHRPFLWSPEVF